MRKNRSSRPPPATDDRPSESLRTLREDLERRRLAWFDSLFFILLFAGPALVIVGNGMALRNSTFAGPIIFFGTCFVIVAAMRNALAYMAKEMIVVTVALQQLIEKANSSQCEKNESSESSHK